MKTFESVMDWLTIKTMHNKAVCGFGWWTAKSPLGRIVKILLSPLILITWFIGLMITMCLGTIWALVTYILEG